MMPLKVLLLKCRKIWITFWATDNNDAKLLMHSWLNRLDVKFGYRQMKRDTIQSSCISIAIVIYCMLWFSSKKTSYKPFFLHATDCTHVLYSFLSATLTVFFFSYSGSAFCFHQLLCLWVHEDSPESRVTTTMWLRSRFNAWKLPAVWALLISP